MPITIRKLTLDQAEQAHDTAVVIDVLRAFTTDAFALNQGASDVLLVSTVEEALALQKQFPGSLTLGEVEGKPLPEFNFSNSPAELNAADLQGKRLIHRSSAGTQGVVRAKNAQNLFAGSFPCAAATARHILALKPIAVDFIVTGTYGTTDGDEDIAFADYVTELIMGRTPDPAPYLERIHTSSHGRRFLSGASPHLPLHDLEFAVALDRFDFAMPIARRNGLLVMERSGNQ